MISPVTCHHDHHKLMLFSIADHTYMALAMQLANQGLLTTQPNPRVGCVIVKDQRVLGQGAHLKAGEAHAEVHALMQAGNAAQGADVYVTLEPCAHHGRTPPCANALIKAGVKRVVVAMQDPNVLVSGNGIKRLQAHGIEVVTGLMRAEAEALNPGFISRMTRGVPYVRSKIAASLDGRTALKNGQSQWITHEAARLDVQHWRARSCAVVTGIGTVLADNPGMTARLSDLLRQPLRVILDSRLQTPVNAKLLSPELLALSPVLIVHNQVDSAKAQALTAAGAELLHLGDRKGLIDLQALLIYLGQRGMNEVLLEAGQGLNGAFLQARLIDELILYYAPKLMGRDAKAMFAIPELSTMQQAINLQIVDLRQVGQDIRVLAKPEYPT